MEPQKAVTVLKNLLEKHDLDNDEKEAVLDAIGFLAWVSLSKSRIKALKEKRKKSVEWEMK